MEKKLNAKWVIGELGCLPESLLNILSLQNKVKLSAFSPCILANKSQKRKRWISVQRQTGIMAKWTLCKFLWPELNPSLILILGLGGRICAFSYFNQSISLPLSKGAFLGITAEIQGVTHPVNQCRKAEWSILHLHVRTAKFSSHMVKIKNKKAKGWGIFKKILKNL